MCVITHVCVDGANDLDIQMNMQHAHPVMGDVQKVDFTAWFDWLGVFDLDAHAQAHNTFSKNMPHAHAHTHTHAASEIDCLIARLIDASVDCLIVWMCLID